MQEGLFCVSYDVELAWGTSDKPAVYPAMEAHWQNGRQCFFKLAELHDRLSVPATWAMVGHIMQGPCGPDAHVQMPKPASGYDRYAVCPCADGQLHDLWHAPDFLPPLLKRPELHDIGCHTYSHLQSGQPYVTPEMAQAEIRACVAAARQAGVREMVSIVFPLHSWGHLETVRQHGFKVTRLLRSDAHWSKQEAFLPTLYRRLSVLGLLPLPLGRAQEHYGLVDVPASVCWVMRVGLGAKIPVGWWVRSIKKAIDRAARTKRVFHVWSHEYNFAVETDTWLAAYADVLEYAKRLEDRGDIRCRNLRQFVS